MTEKKLYCGIDVHKERFVGCVLDKSGEIVKEHEFPSTKEGLVHFLAGISSADVIVAVEACGMWRAAYNLLKELGFSVKLANPVKTNQIACNKKTDKVDAKILADLLKSNYFPEVYIPDEDTLKLRDILRHKCNITRLRVGIQNRIKGYLLRGGIPYKKNIWTKDGLADLRKLKKPELNDLLDTYDFFHKKEQKNLNEIKKKARRHKLARILMTHPGIGSIGSLMIIAEIGDITRFPNYKKLINYAGCAPGIHQSANSCYSVRNNNVNKWLKWIVTECSGRAVMVNNKFWRLFSKMKESKGYKVARREISRKLLRNIYYMLKNEKPYHAS